MDVLLGKLAHVDARTLWKGEASDFTPWLAENLPLLGEALNLDLQLEQREASVGDFFCDIAAREVGTNRPVIVENQLGRTDHNHLGQLLTYAGGLDAAVVIWISPEIRDEHRKALDWLNRHTDEQVDFFGVVVEAIRIDESKPAVQFRPVAVPNDFGKRSAPTAVSERGLIYKSFFQAVIDELRDRYKFTNIKNAGFNGWQNFSSGFSAFIYTLWFSADGNLRAALQIYISDAERNKAVFDFLNQQRDAIDAQMGEKLVWDHKYGRQYNNIYAVRPNTRYSDAATDADVLREWSVSHLLRLKEVFGPKLQEAASAIAPSVAPGLT